jgi:hypothetical protein
MKKFKPHWLDIVIALILAALFTYVIEEVREYVLEQKILNHSEIPTDTTKEK